MRSAKSQANPNDRNSKRGNSFGYLNPEFEVYLGFEVRDLEFEV
jgi:hypothetical protein